MEVGDTFSLSLGNTLVSLSIGIGLSVSRKSLAANASLYPSYIILSMHYMTGCPNLGHIHLSLMMELEYKCYEAWWLTEER